MKANKIGNTNDLTTAAPASYQAENATLKEVIEDYKKIISEFQAEHAELKKQLEAAIEQSTCGCGLCLAHNNMVCPKMRGVKEWT